MSVSTRCLIWSNTNIHTATHSTQVLTTTNTTHTSPHATIYLRTRTITHTHHNIQLYTYALQHSDTHQYTRRLTRHNTITQQHSYTLASTDTPQNIIHHHHTTAQLHTTQCHKGTHVSSIIDSFDIRVSCQIFTQPAPHCRTCSTCQLARTTRSGDFSAKFLLHIPYLW